MFLRNDTLKIENLWNKYFGMISNHWLTLVENPCVEINGMLDTAIIPSSSISLSEPSLQSQVDQIRNGPLVVPSDITSLTITIDLPGDVQLGSVSIGENTNVKTFEIYTKKSTDLQLVLYKVILCPLIYFKLLI